MKNLFILIFFTVNVKAFSQLNLEFNGKGLYNSTWIISKSISDQGKSQDYDLGWGLSYGAGLNLWLGKIGLGIEGIFGKHIGAYTGTVEVAGINLRSIVKLKFRLS